MKAKIPEKLYRAVGGHETWKHYGVTSADRELGWRKYVEIDLEQITAKRLERLAELVAPHSSIKGAAMLLKDIRAWARVARKDKSVKPRTVEQFAALLKQHLLHVPGHRVYERDELSEVTLAYYVEDVSYHPPRESSHGGKIPPSVTADLFWEEFGKRHKHTVTWHAEDCLHLTVDEALAGEDLYVEGPELRAEYLADVERWKGLVNQIGLQLRARGRATDDLDGNPEGSSWSRYNKSTIQLDHTGEPAHLLVDVFSETDKVERDRSEHVDLWFWGRQTMKLGTSDEDGEDDSNDDLDDEEDGDDWQRRQREKNDLGDEDTTERPEVEIPIHPMLACFDMKRHLRLRVHVGCVEVYKYDTALRTKLVLPPDVIDLVEMLIARKGVFKDIVAGKGGGTSVLCCGKPGIGKTLTAEVYSESTERPLYSVQCSQLGTSPARLEAELIKVFARANRWNAILLLDEADVYVMERGTDLEQNAIVGVFLRVLEYYSGVLFLTTNRADKVDDAIASRCIARIDYQLPDIEAQRRIWGILSEVAGVDIPAAVVAKVLETHNNLSGRDIKNLVKLAQLVSEAKGEPITPATIDFVKKFKPTVDYTKPRLVPAMVVLEETPKGKIRRRAETKADTKAEG